MVSRRRHSLGEMIACLSITALSRRQSDSASSLRAGEGPCRARGSNVPGTSPESIQEEPEEGKAADEDSATSDLPPGVHTCPLSSPPQAEPWKTRGTRIARLAPATIVTALTSFVIERAKP